MACTHPGEIIENKALELGSRTSCSTEGVRIIHTEDTKDAFRSIWPEQCRFLDRRITAISALRALLDFDTQYEITPDRSTVTTAHQKSPDPAAASVFIHADGTVTTYVPSLKDNPFAVTNLFGCHKPRPPRHTLLFVRQKRAYMLESSLSRMTLSREEWLQLLAGAEVLPSFLQVLHTTDSACARHMTLTPSDQAHGAHERTLHMSIKIGSWAGNELAIYARQPLRAGAKTLFLYVGTEPGNNCKDMAHRLAGVECADVFSLLFLVVERACVLLDGSRWTLDHLTQELEALTGYSSFKQPWRAAPVPVSKMVFGQKLQDYAQRGRTVIWACARYEETIAFIEEQYSVYRTLMSSELAKDNLDQYSHDTRTLLDAFAQAKSLIRGHGIIATELVARIKAQQEVTRTLIASRDSDTTIQIGKAAKQDSEVMRSIAFVTLIFLPATFLSTFFSMVFFRLEDQDSSGDKGSVGRLRFDTSVWLYPTITVPVTVLVWMWYRQRTVRNSISGLRGMRKMNPARPATVRKEVIPDIEDTRSYP